MKKIQIIMASALLSLLSISNVASAASHKPQYLQKDHSDDSDEIHLGISATLHGVDTDFNITPISPNTPLVFDTVVHRHGHITYENGVFTVYEPGHYEVTYGAITSFGLTGRNVIFPSSFAVRINGVVQPQGNIQASAGLTGDWATASLIFKATAGKTRFEIVSAGTDPLLLLGDASHTVAFATIKRLH